MELKELREKREQAFKRAEALANAAEFDKAKFDQALAEVEGLDSQIEAKRALAEKEALEGALDRGVRRSADERNVSVDQASDEGRRWLQAAGSWMRNAAPGGAPIPDEHRATLANTAPADNPGGRAGPTGTTPDAAGGVAVEQDGVAGDMFYEVLRYKAPVMSIWTVKRRGRGTKAHAPGVDDSANYGRLRGEGVARQKTRPDWVKSEFEFDNFDADWMPVTYEALQDMDVADLGRDLLDLGGARCARMIGYVTTQGNAGAAITEVGRGGANRGTPKSTKGVALAASDGLTTAASNVVTPDEYRRFTMSVDPAYRTPDARLMANQQFVTDVALKKDDENRYLFSHEMMRPQPGALTGRDQMPAVGELDKVPYVLNNEFAAAPAAGKVVAVYGDLRAYCLILTRAITMERFHDSNTANEGEVWFAAWVRGAGFLPDSNAIKRLVCKA